MTLLDTENTGWVQTWSPTQTALINDDSGFGPKTTNSWRINELLFRLSSTYILVSSFSSFLGKVR